MTLITCDPRWSEYLFLVCNWKLERVMVCRIPDFSMIVLFSAVDMLGVVLSSECCSYMYSLFMGIMVICMK